MDLIHKSEPSGIQVMLIRGSGSERERAEQEIVDAGIPLPLMYRDFWAEKLPRWETVFLLARDAGGKPAAGAAIEEVRTRALPGHLVLRLKRFGNGLSIDACRAVLEAADKLARKDKRVLRLQVNIFSKGQCGPIGEILNGLGYTAIVPPSSYRHTLVVNLAPTEDEIFAAFHKSARTRVRETIKKSMKSCEVSDPIYVNRLSELQKEAMRRTGGHAPTEDWASILSMSKEHPDLSQVFGLFLSEDLSPENLMACAWVCSHGDNAEYRASGSTRRDDVRIPFGYMLVWDMIRWSKGAGAKWFDMGGVTLGEGDDPLEGISDFKRFFTREIAEVGAEWLLETSPARSKIASVITGGMDRARQWRNR